jgi:hypothetical protein
MKKKGTMHRYEIGNNEREREKKYSKKKDFRLSSKICSKIVVNYDSKDARPRETTNASISKQ